MTEESSFDRVSKSLACLQWTRRAPEREKGEALPFKNVPEIDEHWPMARQLRRLLYQDPTSSGGTFTTVGKHILGVVASVNDLIRGQFTLSTASSDQRINSLITDLYNYWNRVVALQKDREFAEGFLRISALYHDVGKLISSDRHVSRGVHLMRDVSDEDRKAFEHRFFPMPFQDKYDFWSFLRHHDIFGCLCTGEASLPAIYQMAKWAGPATDGIDPSRSLGAYICYLAMMNIADSDSSLYFNTATPHTGLHPVEAKRYLDDWKRIKDYLFEEVMWEGEHRKRDYCIKREGFRDWLLDVSTHPEYSISRIARLAITAYRMCLPTEVLSDTEVERIVEDELQMLHGARLEDFCYRFTRFCKVDYGLRFFHVLMMYQLMKGEDNVLVRKNRKESEQKFPTEVKHNDMLSPEQRSTEQQKALVRMVNRTCQILKRIVDDYGYLVLGESKSSPLLCIVMAGLMPENEKDTAWALSKALAENSSRAMGWVADEVGICLFGE